MQLTEHFSLEKLIASEVPVPFGIDKTPPANIVSARGYQTGLNPVA